MLVLLSVLLLQNSVDVVNMLTLLQESSCRSREAETLECRSSLVVAGDGARNHRHIAQGEAFRSWTT